MKTKLLFTLLAVVFIFSNTINAQKDSQIETSGTLMEDDYALQDSSFLQEYRIKLDDKRVNVQIEGFVDIEHQYIRQLELKIDSIEIANSYNPNLPLLRKTKRNLSMNMEYIHFVLKDYQEGHFNSLQVLDSLEVIKKESKQFKNQIINKY